MTLLASVMLLASACTGKQASEDCFWTGTCELPYGSGWQADRLVCFEE